MSPLGIPWLTWYCGLVALVATLLLAIRRWSVSSRLFGVMAVTSWGYASWWCAREIVKSTMESGYRFSITGEPLEWPTAQAALAAAMFLVPVLLTPFILAVRAELRQMDAETRRATEQHTASSPVAVEKPPIAPEGQTAPHAPGQIRSIDTLGTQYGMPLN